MKIHIIIDFMHIYYKYFFQLRENRLKVLTSNVEINGVEEMRDISNIYYPLRDIENIRRDFEGRGHDITISVCFDMKSSRTESGVDGATEYKANRVSRLTDDDMINLDIIEKSLATAGYNTYRIEGYEADDIINCLVSRYRKQFEYTLIYTNDKDILINICDNVGVMRFKAKVGYTEVDIRNYEQYLEKEFGTFIPYNSLGLFLSSVGDTADGIKGINKFGKVAFSKLITKVASKNSIDWSKCGDYNELAKIVDYCGEFLTEEQFTELKNSFALVSNIKIDTEINEPLNKTSIDKRAQAYEKMLMTSLIK